MGVSTGHVTAQSQLTTAWFKLNRAKFVIFNCTRGVLEGNVGFCWPAN